MGVTLVISISAISLKNAIKRPNGAIFKSFCCHFSDVSGIDFARRSAECSQQREREEEQKVEVGRQSMN